jgi:hypothetical protein
MTLLALTAELAEVNVILLVTSRAIARELNHCGRFAMTLSASKILVRTRQREVRLRMIELPQLPTVGCMAIAACGAEIALVHIAVGMTVVASGSGTRESMVLMTSRTRRDDVHADEWKEREIVVEADRRTPGIVAVALLALLASRARVNIVQLVT